jgi:hypothetical protein
MNRKELAERNYSKARRLIGIFGKRICECLIRINSCVIDNLLDEEIVQFYL